MTLDVQYIWGTVAAVHSILQNSLCPEDIFFHFTYSDENLLCQSLFKEFFTSLKFKAYYFSPEIVLNKISSAVRENLEPPLNYARNYLVYLLESCVERVIYLDATVILVDDISKLWRKNLASATVGSPEYCHANYTIFHSQILVTEEQRIYDLGSLPPFLFVFAGEIASIDHKSNRLGFGGDILSNDCRQLHPGPSSLLHWNGKGKPWLRLDSGQALPD